MYKRKFILEVRNNAGQTFMYGPFVSVEAAERFAKEECKGFVTLVIQLHAAPRDYNR